MSEHQDEYDDGMVAMLELVWGKGFLTPGGADTVRRTVGGLNLQDRLVLDIGAGIGGADLVLAGEFGARVVGTDLEAPLVERARGLAEEAGLQHRITFQQVEPGPLPFDDELFDLVYSSGCFTQVADKAGMFAEVNRVLQPGGVFAVYDWMKGPDPYGPEMRYWFELEGLTYAMETLQAHGTLLEEAGFANVSLADDGDWYRQRCAEEYRAMQGPLKDRMLELLGAERQAHFLENWRAMQVVLDKGDLRPGYYRAVKPRL